MTQINKGRLFVRQRPSGDELAGIIRRGIAEIETSRPRPSITSRKPKAGSNPYEHGMTGRFKNRHRPTTTSSGNHDGEAFNPYDTVAGLQKGRSRDDLEFDMLEFDEK